MRRRKRGRALRRRYGRSQLTAADREEIARIARNEAMVARLRAERGPGWSRESDRDRLNRVKFR